MILISQGYARALFELANEQNKLDVVGHEFEILQNVLKTNLDFKNLIMQSRFSQKTLCLFFEKLIKAFSFSDLTSHFLTHLVFQKKQKYLDKIVQIFLTKFQDHQNISTVYVKSPQTLTSSQRQFLIQKLEKHLKREINFVEIIDRSLLRGIVIDFEGFRIDTSLKTQLYQWQKEIRI